MKGGIRQFLQLDVNRFSFFMNNLNKSECIYNNYMLGTFLIKLSIPKNIQSPFSYSRNMSYHKNKNKEVHQVMLKLGFNDDINEINREIKTHEIISYGTMRFFNPLCPTLIDSHSYNLQKSNPTALTITNKIINKLVKDKEEISFKIKDKMKKSKYMYYTLMEYIKGETLTNYTTYATFNLVGKDRYVINLQRYLSIELAMIGYQQADIQESNYMIFEHSTGHINTNTRKLIGGENSPRTSKPSRSLKINSVWRTVDSDEAREMIEIENMKKEELNERKRIETFLKHAKKTKRNKEINIVVIDLNSVTPYHKDVIIDWSIDSIKSNYFKINSLLKGGTTFTDRDAEVIQQIKKNITFSQNILEKQGYIFLSEHLPPNQMIKNVYDNYYNSFIAGLKLLGDTRIPRSITSPNRRSNTESPRSLLSFTKFD